MSVIRHEHDSEGVCALRPRTSLWEVLTRNDSSEQTFFLKVVSQNTLYFARPAPALTALSDKVRRHLFGYRLTSLPPTYFSISYFLSHSTILSRALPRWDMLFFSRALISANVLFSSSGMNIGSYPNPFSPLGFRATVPFTVPLNV